MRGKKKTRSERPYRLSTCTRVGRKRRKVGWPSSWSVGERKTSNCGCRGRTSSEMYSKTLKRRMGKNKPRLAFFILQKKGIQKEGTLIYRS